MTQTIHQSTTHRQFERITVSSKDAVTLGEFVGQHETVAAKNIASNINAPSGGGLKFALLIDAENVRPATAAHALHLAQQYGGIVNLKRDLSEWPQRSLKNIIASVSSIELEIEPGTTQLRARRRQIDSTSPQTAE